jgi:hypothetical protein
MKPKCPSSTEAATAPRDHLEALRRLKLEELRRRRKLKEMGETLAQNAREEGFTDLEADARARVAQVRQWRRETVVELHTLRRAHTQVRSSTLPRPRIRARRTRTAARRAAGSRGGSDPGDGSGSTKGDGELGSPAARLRYKLERLGFLRPRDPWRVGWDIADRPEGGIWPIRIRVTLVAYRVRRELTRLVARLGGLR